MVAPNNKRMNQMSRLVRYAANALLGGCLLATAPLYAEPEPMLPVFTAHYELLRNGNMKVGEVKRTTTIAENGIITFESNSKTTGLAALFIKDKISERTTFVLDGNTIQPQHYLYDRNGGKRSLVVNLNFDWPNKSVTSTVNETPLQMSISAGTQDKLSYQLQLMLDLQAGFTTFDYPVADEDTVKTYRFTLLGEETIKTPMGNIATIKLKRERAAGSKRNTTIWFAKSLRYLPVRITQGKSDDEFIMLEIKKVEGL